MRTVTIHWLFKLEPTQTSQDLCSAPVAAREAEHSIILRPIIKQRRGGRLRECPHCATLGKELRIP